MSQENILEVDNIDVFHGSFQALWDISLQVKKGEMPLWNYRLMHPEARLRDEDINTICDAASQGP